MRYSTMEGNNRTCNKPPIKISILEKSSADISYCWKACQLFSYVIVIISGIATSMAMGNILKMFSGECILYSELDAELVPNKSEIVLKPSPVYQKWGLREHCDFCEFAPVASVICAGIWGTFFVMCGHGRHAGLGLPQPWRVVPPAIVFNLIFVVISSVSVVLTFKGFASFCSSLQTSLNVSSCDDLMDYSWQSYPNATFFYDDLIIAETGSAITLAGWVMGFMVLLIRCIAHADFRVVAFSPAPIASSSPAQSESQSTVVTTVTSPASSQTTTPEKMPAANIEAEPLIFVTTESEKKGPENGKKVKS